MGSRLFSSLQLGSEEADISTIKPFLGAPFPEKLLGGKKSGKVNVDGSDAQVEVRHSSQIPPGGPSN